MIPPPKCGPYGYPVEVDGKWEVRLTDDGNELWAEFTKAFPEPIKLVKKISKRMFRKMTYSGRWEDCEWQAVVGVYNAIARYNPTGRHGDLTIGRFHVPGLLWYVGMWVRSSINQLFNYDRSHPTASLSALVKIDDSDLSLPNGDVAVGDYREVSSVAPKILQKEILRMSPQRSEVCLTALQIGEIGDYRNWRSDVATKLGKNKKTVAFLWREAVKELAENEKLRELYDRLREENNWGTRGA